jgi:hypothetical protein
MFILIPLKSPGEILMINSLKLGTILLQDLNQFYFGWSIINKNVNWINYIYYNLQKFVDYAKNTIKVIAKQALPVRWPWKNQIALDMILADKGGVCIMIGGQCCTFILNNTTPDGTIPKTL